MRSRRTSNLSACGAGLQVSVEPLEGVLLHGEVELVASVVIEGTEFVGGVGAFECIGDDGFGALHFLESVEWVLFAIQDHGGCRGTKGEDFGKIEILRQEWGVSHPGVGEDLVEEKVAPGGHEADGDGDLDTVVEATEIDGPHAATG